MNTDELVAYYRRLFDALSDDIDAASECFKGEILVAYRELVQKEQEILQKNLRKIY